MSAVKTQNQQKFSELSKGYNETPHVFHLIWWDILTGSTLLYTQDILELLFLKSPQLCKYHSPHTHIALCGKYPELILDIYLSSLRFKLRLEHGCCKHWTNLLNSTGESRAYISVRLHRINSQQEGRESYRRVSGSDFSVL